MIQFQSITLLGSDQWQFQWDAVPGVSQYRVILFGQLLDVVTDNTYFFEDPSGIWVQYPPPLEVVPFSEVATSEQFSPFFTIQWYDEDADYYSIQLYDGTDWNEVSQISDSDNWVNTFVSPQLTDETTYQYRVEAYDDIGDHSDPEYYTRYVVTPPVLDESTYLVDYDSNTTSIKVVPQ